MIGVSSLDLLAFPVRLQPTGSSSPCIDARRGEVFYAFYRQVPGGVQRLTEPQVGTPDELASELLARGEECLLVGDGALRYREVFDGLQPGRARRRRPGLPVGRRRSCSWPTPRPCARSSSTPWELSPLYLRKPDAEINWSDRGTARDGRPSRQSRPERPRGRVAPMRRRHLRAVLRIEQPGRTRGRGRSACSSPSWRCGRRASTSWPASARTVVGYAGLMLDRRRRPRHHHRRRPGVAPPRRSAPGCCSRLARDGDRARAPPALTLEVRMSQRPPPRRCTAASASRPPACRKNYYARRHQRGRPGHVGPRHRPTPPLRTSASAAHRGRPLHRHDRRARSASAHGRRHRSSASRRRATRPRPRSSPTRTDVLSSVVSSQVDLHARFGGVVPEIASRAHVELLTPVVAEALVEAGVDDADVDAVAATVGPGLIGVAARRASARPRRWRWCGTCRSSASTTSRPTCTPRSSRSPTSSCPLVVLLVSGGHTMLVLDGGPRPLPAARLHHRRRRRRGVRQGGPLPRPRLPGRPGHRPRRHARATRAPSRFPRAMLDDGFDFSLLGPQDGGHQPRPQAPRGRRRADVAASFQEAVVDVLVTKARRAAQRDRRQGPVPRPAAWPPTRCCASGSSTRAWRTASTPFLPSRAMCTDNAAMVAAAGWWRLQQRRPVRPSTPAPTRTSSCPSCQSEVDSACVDQG